MPAPPPESEPAMVSIAGVLLPLCIGKGDIVVSSMMKATSKLLGGKWSGFNVKPRN